MAEQQTCPKCPKCLHWFASCMCSIHGQDWAAYQGNCSDFEPRGGCANCHSLAREQRVRALADKWEECSALNRECANDDALVSYERRDCMVTADAYKHAAAQLRAALEGE